MSESRVRRVPARGIEIEVEEAGRGERPFVLVHGYTGSRDDFLEVIPQLARAGRTLAVDQRGHGGSTNSGVEADYLLDNLVDDLDAALRAADVESCDLLGHSMGGMVAMRFALAHPGRVRSLVLMDTVARPFRFLPPAVLEGARALIAGGGMEGLFQLLKASPRPQPPSHLRWKDEIGEPRYWERIRAKIVAMDPAAWLGLGGQDFGGVLDRLGEIRCRTTVMVGAEDVVFLGPSDEMSAAIPGARRVTIPNAAHSPQFENPSAWLAAVEAHLAWARSEGDRARA